MKCPKCGKRLEAGYGMAGGGIGPYFYCETEGCGTFIKSQDPEMENKMPTYTQYRRKQISELTPWAEGFDMSNISVSEEDRKAGSPRPGDMIARNPWNHDDKWLIAAKYFADNFEPIE